MNVKHKLMRVLFLLVVFSGFFIAGGGALAQPPSGDLCFNIHLTEREDGPMDESFAIKMHFVPVDATLSTVHGLVKMKGDGPFIASGTAARVGEAIYINLTGTQTHTTEPWRDSAVIQARLNADTLSGNIWSIGQDFNTQTRRFDFTYSAGKIVEKVCR